MNTATTNNENRLELIARIRRIRETLISLEDEGLKAVACASMVSIWNASSSDETKKTLQEDTDLVTEVLHSLQNASLRCEMFLFSLEDRGEIPQEQ